MIRIALIEDDIRFANHVAASVRLQPDILFVFHADSVEDFERNAPTKARIDILFLDIDLPGCSGVAALPALRRRLQETEIVMLTHSDDADTMLRALHLGAGGYLNKDFSLNQLPDMIRVFAKGGALISPIMARKLVRHFHPGSDTRPYGHQLSPKESQLLHLFDGGYSYEEAASMLNLSVDGVRYHVKNIYKKLNVKNKLDALKVFKNS